MKIVSFNVNGIRARQHQLEALVEKYQPDIIGLQETKVQDPDFPHAMIDALGYKVSFFGQKSHYGVATLAKQVPAKVQHGFDVTIGGELDTQQRRLLTTSFALAQGPDLHIVNGYFPQGESRDHPDKFPAKRKFYADLLAFLQQHFSPDDYVVVLGDMNVAPHDEDVGIGADNAKRWLRTGKCCFLPEERDWLQRLEQWGLTDVYHNKRATLEDPDRYSWFDYRSKGFEREPRRGLRIDLLLLTQPLLDHYKSAGISYSIRAMDKPSDHCPVWVELCGLSLQTQ